MWIHTEIISRIARFRATHERFSLGFDTARIKSRPQVAFWRFPAPTRLEPVYVTSARSHAQDYRKPLSTDRPCLFPAMPPGPQLSQSCFLMINTGHLAVCTQ